MIRLLRFFPALLQQATDEWITDTDLDREVRSLTGDSPGRNVIAKVRQQLELEGYIERDQDIYGKPVLHEPIGGGRAVLGFRLTPEGERYLWHHA